MENSKRYNVFEINKIYLEPESPFGRLIPERFRHTSVLYCVIFSIIVLAKLALKALIKAPMKFKFARCERYANLYDGTILFRTPTLNNKRSLSKIVERVSSERENIRVVEGVLEFENYPVFRLAFVSLMCLPSFWKGFMKLNHNDRLIVNYYLIDYVYTPGVIWFYKKMTYIYKPECVVLANDHTFLTKPLEFLCEDHGIPCIYVQHASVSYAFPELHFAHSFLDGTDSLRKYTSEGKYSKGNLFLLGAARFDRLSEYRLSRNNSVRKCIGISLNKLDDNAIVDNVCNALLNCFPDWKIKIRTHPGMKDTPFSFTNKDRIIYTCATDESMIVYLDSIDFQISNDSSVHLDAILGGVKSVAYNMSHREYGDNYGYVKNGMLHLAENIEQLCDFVKGYSNIRIDIRTVQQYDESYGKKYAGKCGDIIADFILSGCKLSYLETKYGLTLYKGEDIDGAMCYKFP